MTKGRKGVAIDGQLKGKIFLLDVCFIYFSYILQHPIRGQVV